MAAEDVKKKGLREYISKKYNTKEGLSTILDQLITAQPSKPSFLQDKNSSIYKRRHEKQPGFDLISEYSQQFEQKQEQRCLPGLSARQSQKKGMKEKRKE